MFCPSLLVQILVLFLVLHYLLPLLKKAPGTAEKLAQGNCLWIRVLSVFSCNFSCSTFDFLVQFLVLYFRFSRAISRALLSISSCTFLCSTFGFLVQFLVLYFRFSRAISRALLSIFSCNFSCSTFDFLVQFLVLYFWFSRAISCATVTEISRQKKDKMKKTQKRTTVPVCTFCLIAVGWLFQNKSKSVEITTSDFVSGQFFNSALYVSCGGRCMWSLEHFSHYKAGIFGKRCLIFGHFSRATSGGVSRGHCYSQ